MSTTNDVTGTSSANPPPKLILKKALAKRYSVGPRTIQTWVSQRIIPFIRMSGGQGRGLLLFDPKACDAALSRFGGVKELPITKTRPRRKPLRRLKLTPEPQTQTGKLQKSATALLDRKSGGR